MKNFIIPEGLIGRFAVIKLWPDLKAAEDECIARLKVGAAALGLKCVEIYSDGRLIDDPDFTITKDDVDFVLHLHYDTPKLYDAFSFVALWNPVEFYHKWGYSRCSRNLLSHDDFISCSSAPADHHLRRLIRKSAIHLPPAFNLYHSVSDIVYSPSLGDHKLFYAGINWDVLGGGKSRHQELLNDLDSTGILRIYGPTIFQDVRVWEGYESYMGEIPFDGISMIEEIAKAGIALVLSSKAHKQSELMTNRLFESIAAGALVICDENKFAKKFFGDTLLYIDSRCSVEETSSAIFAHLNWAKNNPQEALNMVSGAQEIFKQKFSLKKNLCDLYQDFSERKFNLNKANYPVNAKPIKISLNLLMPEYSDKVLNSHITSIVMQDYKHFSPTLVIDSVEANKNRDRLKDALANLAITVNVLELDFFSYGMSENIKQRRNTGEIIAKLLDDSEHDAIVFVAPNEKIFSNHLQILAGSLVRNPHAGCIATSTIIKDQLNVIYGTYEKIDFRQLDAIPIGYARFIFRLSTLAGDLNLALPYLDRKAMAILIGDNEVHQEAPSTVVIDAGNPFPVDDWDEGQENELISSFCSSVFKVLNGYEIYLPRLASPEPLSVEAQINEVQTIPWIVAQLYALQREGFIKRLRALKRKFALLKTQDV